MARWYGVHIATVIRWIDARHLRACKALHQHYTDNRERKTSRGRWRIYEADLLKFLKRARGGELPVRMFGKGFWQGRGDE